MSTPRIAILTSLSDFNRAYSICGVILDQLHLLHDKGHEVALFVNSYFNPADRANFPERFDVRYTMPGVPLHDYKPEDEEREEFAGQVEKFEQAIEAAVQDFDVVITHDWMFLAWYLPQNAAVRRVAERHPRKRWLHWAHSAPSLPPKSIVYPSTLRHTAAPHGQYVFLNHHHRSRYAHSLFRGEVGASATLQAQDIAVVPNARDLRDVYGFDDDTRRLIDDARLLDHDVLQVYPFSSTRWMSKGVDRLAAIFGGLKKRNVRAKLVLCNAHCNQAKDEKYERQIQGICELAGLVEGEDFVVTSAWARKVEADLSIPEGVRERIGGWRYAVPHRVVRELQLAANLFVFPSPSECCSLIQGEASVSGGKLMVLNRSFLPMLEFGAPSDLSFEFGIDPRDNPRFYDDVAGEIWSAMRSDQAIQAATLARTRTYNRDWIYERSLRPLIERRATHATKQERRGDESERLAGGRGRGGAGRSGGADHTPSDDGAAGDRAAPRGDGAAGDGPRAGGRRQRGRVKEATP